MMLLRQARGWFQGRRDRQALALGEGHADLVTLWKKGLIHAKGTGQSITEIRASLTSRVSVPLKIQVPHGTYFVSTGGHQNMVTRRSYELKLGPYEAREISLPASCINANLPIPGDNDRFRGVARVPETLRRFLQASEGEDAMTVQSGVWAITDGYSRSMIQSHLRVQRAPVSRGGRGLPREPGTAFDSGSAVSDHQIERAKQIMDTLDIRHRLNSMFLNRRRFIPWAHSQP